MLVEVSILRFPVRVTGYALNYTEKTTSCGRAGVNAAFTRPRHRGGGGLLPGDLGAGGLFKPAIADRFSGAGVVFSNVEK